MALRFVPAPKLTRQLVPRLARDLARGRDSWKPYLYGICEVKSQTTFFQNLKLKS